MRQCACIPTQHGRPVILHVRWEELTFSCASWQICADKQGGKQVTAADDVHYTIVMVKWCDREWLRIKKKDTQKEKEEEWQEEGSKGIWLVCVGMQSREPRLQVEGPMYVNGSCQVLGFPLWKSRETPFYTFTDRVLILVIGYNRLLLYGKLPKHTYMVVWVRSCVMTACGEHICTCIGTTPPTQD